MLKNILKNNFVSFIHKIFCIPTLYTILWIKKNFSVNHKNRFNDKEKCIWEDLTNMILRDTFYLMW